MDAHLQVRSSGTPRNTTRTPKRHSTASNHRCTISSEQHQDCLKSKMDGVKCVQCNSHMVCNSNHRPRRKPICFDCCTHINKNTFKCTQCDFETGLESSLHDHVQTKHTKPNTRLRSQSLKQKVDRTSDVTGNTSKRRCSKDVTVVDDTGLPHKPFVESSNNNGDTSLLILRRLLEGTTTKVKNSEPFQQTASSNDAVAYNDAGSNRKAATNSSDQDVIAIDDTNNAEPSSKSLQTPANDVTVVNDTVARPFVEKSVTNGMEDYSFEFVDSDDEDIKGIIELSVTAHPTSDFPTLPNPEADFPFVLTCPVCHWQTTSKESLEEHQMLRKKCQRGFKCVECGVRFMDQTRLDHHLAVVHVPQIFDSYVCHECNFTTGNKKNLSRHIRRRHMSQRRFKCPKCPFQASEKFNLKAHMYSKHVSKENKQQHQCKYCDYKTCVKLQLHQHVIDKHPVIDIDQLGHMVEQAMKKTEETAADTKEDVWFECYHCQYKTKYKGTLRDHMTYRHTETEKIPWVRCDKCPYKGKRRGDLNKHYMVFHQENARVFKCEHCPYETKLSAFLKQHTRNKHTKDDEIKWNHCPFCDYRAKTTGGLTHHIGFRHVDISSVDDSVVLTLSKSARDKVVKKEAQSIIY